MSKLRKLTLKSVVFCLPALQPVATQLLELNVYNSRLQGSSDGFLTRGWTALTIAVPWTCPGGDCHYDSSA